MAYVACDKDVIICPQDKTDSSPFSYEPLDNPSADIPQGAFKAGTHDQFVAKFEETNPKFTLVGVWKKGHGLRCLKSDGSIGTRNSCKILCVRSEWEWQGTTSNGYVKYMEGNPFTPVQLGSDDKNFPIYLGRGVKSGKIGVVRKSGDCYVCYIIPEVGGIVEKCQDFQLLCAVYI